MNAPQVAALLLRRRRRHTSRHKTVLAQVGKAGYTLGAGLAVLAIAVLLLGGLVYADLSRDLPSLQALPAMFEPPNGSFLQPTRLYDRTGQHVIHTLAVPGVERRFLPIDPEQPDHLSPHLVRLGNAVLDPGTSPDLARRLVGDLLLPDEPPGWRRDLRQQFLALQVTYLYGTEGVLEYFLNSAYFGHLAYGAEAAAQTYLAKSAASLTLSEAALLIGLVDTPALNPIDAPEAARQHQEDLLRRLVESGDITSADFLAAVKTPLQFRLAGAEMSLSIPTGRAAAEAAFVRQATAELETLVGQTALERGGWEVTTTLDYDLQLQAACASQTWMDRLADGDEPVSDSLLPDESTPAQGIPCDAARLLPTLRPGSTGPRLGSDLRTSAILLDPQTGQILALAGEISTTGETRILHGHPPGSVLTPFIYLTGFSRGFGPASLVWDIPSRDEDEPAIGNPDGQFHGPIRQRTALANDYWTPAAGLLAELGSAEVWRLASRFGLPEAYASLETGRGEIPFPFAGGEIDLVQAAQAYGVLANQGILTGRAAPASSGTSLAATTLLKVESAGGNVVLDASQIQSQAIVGQPLAYLINSVLGDSLARRASLGYPNPLDIGRPAAAKLGRTANGMDTWAVGYTPHRVAGVWLGRGPGSPEMESQSDSPLDPSLAAGLWHALIQYAVQDLPADGWVPPAGIISMEVCDPSGLLPTQACPAVVDEVFLSGNQPVSVDSLYQVFQVNRETQQLATVFTPPEWIESQVYPVYPPAAQEWARQAGLPFAPDTYDAIQPAVAFPDAFLSDPEMFAVVSGVVEIQGTASGDDFSYYRLQVGSGINPQEWVQIQPDNDQPVISGKLAQWDTRGLSGLYALRLMVVHSGQQVQTATLQVTVDNSPPRAWIQYPSPEQAVELSPSGTITLLAQAEDQIGLQQVDWLIDGRLISRQEQGPYHYTWNATPGSHTVQVQVTDLAGNQAESNPVVFTVVE